MREKSNLFRIKRKTVAYIVAILIALAGVTPVLADYLGPDRTVTETVNVCKVLLKKCSYVNGVYKYKTVNSWSCSLESKPWKAYPSNSVSCNQGNFGYQYWTTSNTQKDVTTTYPPATVSSELQNCTLNNGWCNTAAELVVTGDEPVLGYDIFAIEGALNGQDFACADSSCIVPLNEGINAVDYWALSSWGDSSTKGTFTTKVDSQAPNITGTVSGTSGANGWYLSPISINGFASDATSGLAAFTCALDGTTLGSCSSISVNNDGPHTLILTASDNAGNVNTINQSASVDTQNPILTAGLNGSLGSNSWYTDATLNATASDPTPGSGLSAIEYSLDNNAWITFPGTGTLSLPNGKHTVDIRAVDNAGRTVSSSKTFWLDSTAPDITVDPTGTLGMNNWYTTNLDLTASTTDETSGTDIFEYSLDNSTWIPYTVPLTLTDGTHSVSFWSQDQAGLVKQVNSTFQVDTHPPQIAGNVSGVLGSNGWYISDVTLYAAASDPTPGSGLEALTYTLNNDASTSYTIPVALSDGQHTVQFTAQDQAGLNYSVEQNIKVDTVHPTLAITSSFPNWVKDTVTLNGTASDSGSGVSKVEISTDSGKTWQLTSGTTSWSSDWNTQNNTDGSYDIRVRVTDQAGLTDDQTINIRLDNHAPQISLPDSWLQWSSVTLDVWDDFSGISEARVEISDPKNRYPKRVINLDPNQFPLSLKWDRRFGNKEVAPSGTYDVKVIATDNLGHTTEQNATVKVVLSILPSGPTATPQPYLRAISTPISTYTAVPVSSPTITPTAVISGFGEIEPTVQATSTPEYLPTPRATPTKTSVLDWFESFFVPDTDSKNTVTELTSPESSDARYPDSQSNILWSAAAAAMVGAATSYAQEERRKQQEEKARRAALEEQREERHDKIQARKLEKAETQRAQEAAWEAAQSTPDVVKLGKEAKLDRMEQQFETNWIATQLAFQQKEEEKRKEEQRKKAAERAEAKLEAAEAIIPDEVPVSNDVTTSAPEEKSWWEKAWDSTKNIANKAIKWADDHQTEIALGIGIAAGATVLLLTAGIATPLVAGALVLSATAAAEGTVALGTIALNLHYGRDWNENLKRNVAVAGIAAFAVSGAGFLFQAASSGLSAYCAVHTTTCSHIEPVFNALDKAEEGYLSVKLGYQNWKHDPAAGDTLLQLEMEHLDGGMPGNSVAKDLEDEIAGLTDDAMYLLEHHGDDILPLLIKYQDDAVDIINAYGDDGIAILEKYGDEAIGLVKKYGTPAVNVMTSVGPEAAKKLLGKLDNDVLDYAIQQGPDAVAALAGWSADDLEAHGVELALRAKKDAKVLSDIRKLISSGPIDPKALTEEQRALIDAIAANSTQYADEGQVVLGKWVDISNGFVERAKDTGSIHYNPHPDMWNLLGGLGEENQSEVAWLINKQVVQTGINKGLPFEYSLNGVPDEILENEDVAIQAIFSGKSDTEIMRALNTKVIPIRMRELKELQQAGYKLTFDEVSNSYILIHP